MIPPPGDNSDPDCDATSPAVRMLLEQLITRVAQLEEQKGAQFQKLLKPPASDGRGGP